MSFSNRVAASPKPPVVSPGAGAGGQPASNGVSTGKVDVDTFVPDGDFDNFLEEADIGKERSVMAVNNVDSR